MTCQCQPTITIHVLNAAEPDEHTPYREEPDGTFNVYQPTGEHVGAVIPHARGYVAYVVKTEDGAEHPSASLVSGYPRPTVDEAAEEVLHHVNTAVCCNGVPDSPAQAYAQAAVNESFNRVYPVTEALLEDVLREVVADVDNLFGTRPVAKDAGGICDSGPCCADLRGERPDVQVEASVVTVTRGSASVAVHRRRDGQWELGMVTHEADKDRDTPRPPYPSQYNDGRFPDRTTAVGAAAFLLDAVDAWYEAQHRAAAAYEKAMSVSGVWTLPDAPEPETINECSPPVTPYGGQIMDGNGVVVHTYAVGPTHNID